MKILLRLLIMTLIILVIPIVAVLTFIFHFIGLISKIAFGIISFCFTLYAVIALSIIVNSEEGLAVSITAFAVAIVSAGLMMVVDVIGNSMNRLLIRMIGYLKYR